MYGPWENSDTRNAYLHDVLFDDTGRLHITWVYREVGASPASNHDLHYAWSDDCILWHNNAGDPIANIAEGNPIALDDPGIVVCEIPIYAWLMNQCGMTLDHHNQPHVATFHMQDPWRPDVLVHNPPPEVFDRFFPYHYWRDVDGGWHSSGAIIDPDRDIDTWGRMRRPNIVVDKENRVVIYYATATGYRCHTASPSDGYSTWGHFAMTGNEFGATDAGKHDRRLLRDRGILSFTGEPGVKEGQTAFAVIDFEVNALAG